MGRSFHYDEYAETIDAYVNRIKQMAVLFNYGEPHIIELFRNTLPSRLCWVLFSINNLRDAVDAAKRVLTKEKIDRQLSGQSNTTTPFMKVGEVHHSNNKTVSFNTHDPIRYQLDSCSMVYNLSIQKEENNLRPFKPQIHQKKEEDKTDKMLVIETEIDHSVEIEKDKTLDLTIGDNCKIDIHKVDVIIGQEAIDAKIMV